MCQWVPSYVLILWENCLDLWGTDSQCKMQLSWPVRNRLTLQRHIALTHKEPTHGVRDFMNEFSWPRRNRLIERGTLWMNFPDPQGTDSWSEGLYEWISLTHKEQTCGAIDLMDDDYLMTVLTREDLAHSAKTYLDWEFFSWLPWPLRN